MRAADYSWEAPPSPVRTKISSSAIIAHRLRHKRHSVPPKESNACFYFVRGCLPQSLHSPQFSEPDPIYPYLPFLFCLPLWQRPCQQGYLGHLKSRIEVFTGISLFSRDEKIVRQRTQARRSCTPSIQTGQYKRTIIARSLPGLWKSAYKVLNFSRRVVEMRGDSETIESWCRDDLSRL